MNWAMENELTELAHTMRLLTVRYLEGNVGRAEHSRELVTLLEQFKRMDAEASVSCPVQRTDRSAANLFAQRPAFLG
jgi:hypothetical protein